MKAIRKSIFKLDIRIINLIGKMKKNHQLDLKTSSARLSNSLKLFIILIILSSSLSSKIVCSAKNQDATKSSVTSPNTLSSQSFNKQTNEQSKIDNKLDHQQQLVDDLSGSSSSIRGQVMETPSTSPSITSVHQVWTSASSGSLDELSPEMIGKLRSDVPFLAAYALRPRLVGGLMSQHQTGSSKLVQAEQPAFQKLNQFGNQQTSSSLASRSNADLMLDTGASSPQGSTESLVPKLGDFSEFRVETSSTSKSEHHHNRRTSLKRESEKDLRMKKRVLTEASQLVKKRRRNNNNNKLAKTKNRSRKTSRAQKRGRKVSSSSRKSKSSKRKGALLKRAGRLRSKLNRRNLQHHMNIIRHGRYLQEQSAEAANDLDEPEVRDASAMGATKGGDSTDGVKGGKSAGKKPFYSKVLPASSVRPPNSNGNANEDDANDEDSGDDKNLEGDDGKEMTTPKSTSTTDSNTKPAREDDSSDKEDKKPNVNEVDDDVELDTLPEPKRVGDADVDEEGDTVTVMPKSDGVDDDPELPDYDDQGAKEPSATPAAAPAAGDDEEADERESENDEPRTRRINRERPNNKDPAGSNGSDDNINEDDRQPTGGSSSVGGGGIGATIGGSGSNGAVSPQGGSKTPEDSESDNDGDDGDDENGASTPQPGDGNIKPGVELADDDKEGGRKSPSANGDAAGDSGISDSDDDDNEDAAHSQGGSGSSTGSKGVDGESSVNSKNEPEDFESKKEKSGGRKIDESDETEKSRDDEERKVPTTTKHKSEDDDDKNESPDVDYRDEMDSGSRKSGGSSSKVDHNKEDDDLGGSKEKKHESKDKHCDDGSYNHHDDHHGHGHHDHHNSIKWLQDAIPGEPNQDYPILSKANVTNFRCSDHKYPGYYADVDARCQVFHICQADGRQDSFLCPNGTIFSQKTYVCVWWNSFDCEDAPKYYDLNALLYKSSLNSKNLRPLDGERISPSSRENEGSNHEGGADEESSIDSLIRSMRRKTQTEGANRHQDRNEMVGPTDEASLMNQSNGRRRDSASIAPDDEATIQRKSTNIEDEPSLISGSSRLRARNSEHRRKRRASVKQGPPKLRPKQGLRVTIKRPKQVRLGIKPKRRA